MSVIPASGRWTAVSGIQRCSQLYDSDSEARAGYTRFSVTVFSHDGQEPGVLLRALWRNPLENDLL